MGVRHNYFVHEIFVGQKTSCERNTRTNEVNTVVRNTLRSAGTILVDGVRNMGSGVWYQDALEFEP
jgi:hypothetical protein